VATFESNGQSLPKEWIDVEDGDKHEASDKEPHKHLAQTNHQPIHQLVSALLPNLGWFGNFIPKEERGEDQIDQEAGEVRPGGDPVPFQVIIERFVRGLRYLDY
jgi:hypothetical protein